MTPEILHTVVRHTNEEGVRVINEHNLAHPNARQIFVPTTGVEIRAFFRRIMHNPGSLTFTLELSFTMSSMFSTVIWFFYVCAYDMGVILTGMQLRHTPAVINDPYLAALGRVCKKYLLFTYADPH